MSWFQYGRSPQHDFRATSQAPSLGGLETWRYAAGLQSGSPIANASSVFVGSSSGLAALDLASGRVLWTHASGAVSATPALTPGGSLLAPLSSGQVLRLRASTGARSTNTKSQLTLSQSPLPSISLDVAGTTFFVSTAEGRLFAFGADDLSDTWLVGPVGFTNNISCATAPAASASGLMLVGCSDAVVYAVAPSAADAKASVSWTFRADSALQGSVAVSESGLSSRALFASDSLFSVSLSTGALIWNFSNGAAFGAASTPAIFDANSVILAQGTNLLSIDGLTGSKQWMKPMNASCSSPIVDDSGVVLVSCSDGALKALRAQTGELMWTVKLSDASASGAAPPAPIVVNNFILAPTLDGFLVARGPGPSPPPTVDSRAAEADWLGIFQKGAVTGALILVACMLVAAGILRVTVWFDAKKIEREQRERALSGLAPLPRRAPLLERLWSSFSRGKTKPLMVRDDIDPFSDPIPALPFDASAAINQLATSFVNPLNNTNAAAGAEGGGAAEGGVGGGGGLNPINTTANNSGAASVKEVTFAVGNPLFFSAAGGSGASGEEGSGGAHSQTGGGSARGSSYAGAKRLAALVSDSGGGGGKGGSGGGVSPVSGGGGARQTLFGVGASAMSTSPRATASALPSRAHRPEGAPQEFASGKSSFREALAADVAARALASSSPVPTQLTAPSTPVLVESNQLPPNWRMVYEDDGELCVVWREGGSAREGEKC